MNFSGFTASKSSVMLKGYFGGVLNDLRADLRDSTKEAGLVLNEPFENVTAHVNLLRFKKKLSNPELFVKKVSLCDDYFGSFFVDRMNFVLMDWYNLNNKVFNTYFLG